MSLCKDIAEFGVFALALRNGALSSPDSLPGAAASSPAEPARASAPPPAAGRTASPGSSPPAAKSPQAPPQAGNGRGASALAPLLIAGAVGGLILLAIFAVAALKLLG